MKRIKEASFLRVAYVRPKGSQWFVYSYEGKKLSKGYPSKKQAEECLNQIECFKHKDKKSFLCKRLCITVARLKKRAVKEYFDEQEIMELLSDGLPDLKVEKMPGEKRDFAGMEEKELPFAYGEIPNYINPADDMGWDVILLPSTLGCTRSELAPVGILRYSRNVNYWDTFPGDDPIGNDKILLGQRVENGDNESKGSYTVDDLNVLSEFFEGTQAFESPEFLCEPVQNVDSIASKK